MAEDHPLHWRWSNPWPHGGNVFDMAQGFGLTVQVAERGQVYTSEDLLFWQSRQSGTSRSLRGVTFFRGRLVITGERGTVLYANALDDFHAHELSTDDWLEGVAASSNLVVAVGDNAAIYTSQDGIAWNRQAAPFLHWLRGVAYASGTFVTVGESGLIATSPDGSNWTQRSSGTIQHLNRVAWVHERFWITGDAGVVLTSPNSGMIWTPVALGASNALNAATGDMQTRLVVGDLEVRLRTGGSVWQDERDPAKQFPAPGWTYYSALWDGSFYFISGRSGMMVEGFQTNATSPFFWVQRQPAVRNWLWEVTRLPEFYLAVGYLGTLMTSGNGIDWDLELAPETATNSVLLGVGGTTNLLLAVGEKGTVLLSPNTFTNVVLTNAMGMPETNQTSTLGVLWQSVEPRPATNDLQGITLFADQFVVTGAGGTVLLSSNGTQWTRAVTPTTNFLSGVASFPGGLVAVGARGTLLTSPDGQTWTRHETGTTNWLFRVRFLGDQLIVVGQNGSIFTSGEGVHWTARPSGTTRWLNDVTRLGDAWYIAGNQGTVLASTDTTNWTKLGVITEKSLFGLAHHGGQLLAVGVEGAILRSQVIPDTNAVRFLRFARHDRQNLYLFAGQPDQRFTLDRSYDLTNWVKGTSLEFLDATGTLLYLEDTGSNAPVQQFYRGTLAP